MVAGSDGDSETGAGLPVESCSAHGGQQGPRGGPRTPHSLPPASPTCHARLLRALGCRGGGVVSFSPTSSHSLVFVAVGSPNAFLSTMLFHYIMSIM